MAQIAARTRRSINFSSLAQDLVLYGQDDLDGVLRAHNLDELDAEELLANSEPLRRRIADLRKQIDADPTAILRMKASSLLEGSLPRLSSLIQDQEVEAKDVVNAIKLAAELANAMPKDAKGATNSGVVLQMNFGSGTPPPDFVVPAPTNRLVQEADE